eukprot:scaffold22788_cov128-Isochrysis_galbana.AAC.4
MSDADNGQRLGAILARLRAVAGSASAQQGRYPAGELTASQQHSCGHTDTERGPATCGTRGRGPCGRPPSDSGLRPGRQPGGIRQGRSTNSKQLHDLEESVAVSGPDPYTVPSNGTDRVPETHRHSPDSGQCQAPPSNLTAALPGRPRVRHPQGQGQGPPKS